MSQRFDCVSNLGHVYISLDEIKQREEFNKVCLQSRRVAAKECVLPAKEMTNREHQQDLTNSHRLTNSSHILLRMVQKCVWPCLRSIAGIAVCCQDSLGVARVRDDFKQT